jgi:hypothetical protein
MQRSVLGMGLGLAALLTATAASATIMEATYTGVADAGLIDDGGFFGAPGADLSGDAFTLSFVYDTTIGVSNSSGENALAGGEAIGTPNPTSKATLTIGGVSASFTPDFFSGVSSSATQFSNAFGAGNTEVIAFFNGAGQHDLTDSFSVTGSCASCAFIDLSGPVLPDTIGVLDVSSLSVSPFAAGVPEPDAWALMILGFGSAGAMLRSRRLGLAAV